MKLYFWDIARMNNFLITYLQLLAPIPEGDQKLIMASFRKRIAREGEYLFEGGSVCTEMFFICSGVLKITVSGEKGTDITHYFIKENQFCTILKSFDNGVNALENIVAACDAEVLAVSKRELLALYQKLPYLKTMIDQITQQRLLDKIQLRNSYLGKDAATRYKLFIMQQSDIALRVSLQDIASYLEITPQSLSRIRKNLLTGI
jgi:CRP-like cAMP-binding protein